MVRFSFLAALVAITMTTAITNAAVYHVDGGDPAAADTNPGDAAKPFRSISRAAKAVVPGDRVLIHTGIYREQVEIKTSGTAEKPIVFEAAPAARVMVTGADVLSGLTKEPGESNIYSAAWPHRFITWNKSNTHPDDSYHLVIGRSEQVIVEDYLLRQVVQRSQLARGTFYVDLDAKRIYLWDGGDHKLTDDWGAPLVEASVRTGIWLVEGEHVHTRGLRFRHAANMAQHGAVQLKGAHDMLEDCVVERVNACGASFSHSGIVVRRCTFRENGQMGFGASRAHDLLMTDCLIEGNNTKGYDRGWEAGGNKLALCRNAVLERSRFVRNRGIGIWFDIGNENCTVRNCLIADNEQAGLFYEISFGLHAHDNVIVGNGYIHSPGAWGANGAISTSSSPKCLIERNLMLANREGFQFRDARRTTPLIDQKQGEPEITVWDHDSTIRNNIIAWNSENQIGGWFDNDPAYYWPKAMQEEALKPLPGKAAADMAAAYKAAEAAGRPADLTLEGLNLQVTGNLFATLDRQQVCQWGTSWRFHRIWKTAAQTAAQLPNFRGNLDATLTVADFTRLDLRVPAGSPAATNGCYPQGEVPGVTLGILP
jgi:Right handed beta helix region/Chondroitinase B